jgi:hypothetical protein
VHRAVCAHRPVRSGPCTSRAVTRSSRWPKWSSWLVAGGGRRHAAVASSRPNARIAGSQRSVEGRIVAGQALTFYYAKDSGEVSIRRTARAQSVFVRAAPGMLLTCGNTG